MPPWDDIRYFLALARSGSLSGAARALGVEHSTVARRVGQLEAELGARLFDRLPRGWQLTEDGRELVRRAEAIEEAVLGFRRAAAGGDPVRGSVRVSAPPLLLSEIVVPGLSAFLSLHPAIGLELVGERREADLRQAEVDIALRLGRPSEPELVIRALGEVVYGVYGLAHWIERPAQERVYLGFDASMPDLPQKLWLEEEAGEAPVRIRSNDLGTLLAAALAGHGLALLPAFLAERHPGLKALAPAGAPLARPAFLVLHPDKRRSARVRLTADALAEIVSRALRRP